MKSERLLLTYTQNGNFNRNPFSDVGDEKDMDGQTRLSLRVICPKRVEIG
jgi:hypothetical protein